MADQASTGHWFKPHSYGYGATPANWKGWAATGVFMVVVLATSLVAFGWQPDSGTPPSTWQIAAWAVVTAILTGGFVWLARAKTDGQWGWRWGKWAP